MGDKPHYRLIKKAAEGKKWDIIGAAWKRDNSDSLSVVIELVRGGEKIKALLVKNEPKPAEETSQEPMQTQFSDEVPF